MSYKKQLTHQLSQQESYPHQYELQTIGMRIRKAVSDGYQTQAHQQLQQVQIPQSQPQQSQFQRVPLPSNVVIPPLLSNTSSSMSTFGSNLEEWENNLDLRLNTIENHLQTDGLNKRRFESIDNDW